MARNREFDIRFAAAKRGQICSGVWAVWRNKDSIYLSPSNTGGEAHFSLHDGQNGRRYRFAATSTRLIRNTGGDGMRPPLIAWDRRDTPCVGFSHALGILFAPELLRSRADIIDPKVNVLELPERGRAIEVDVAFTFQDPAEVSIGQHQTLLGLTRLSSGESCYIIKSVIEFDFDKFRADNASLTWSVEKTLVLAALGDPNLSLVLVLNPSEPALPIVEISNIVFEGLAKSS
jgi:hypothetical protein